MKSLTIYKCSKFDITDSVALLQDNEDAGNIAPNGDSIIISKKSFLPFTCTYNVKVKQDILVLINSAYTPVPFYKESNSFPAFYSNKENLLFVFAPSPVAKGFTDALVSTYNDKVKLDNTLKFDFNTIKTFEESAKGLYFAVDEATINSKHFFGTGVEKDDEAAEAIDEQRATYLMAKIDILGKSRTIGFSKKGAMVLYSKPSDIKNEHPYLELATETLKAIQLLK